MTITLTKTVASNTSVDGFDILQVKKALNRLGFYTPLDKTGINKIPDEAVFKAIRDFQSKHSLPVTGEIRPGDATAKMLNNESAKTPEGSYIWRTVEDGKVRQNHAQYNRILRSWADSPDPGQDFNCRCWAEPTTFQPQLVQEVITPVTDSPNRWGKIEFVKHFYKGGGKTVTLAEIGLFQTVLDHAKKIMFDRVLAQVARDVEKTGFGNFTGTWNNVYNFKPVAFSLGNSNIQGQYGGYIQKDGDILNVNARAHYRFRDFFTDPANIREIIFGGSDPVLAKSSSDDFFKATEGKGDSYSITGEWETKITGIILIKK